MNDGSQQAIYKLYRKTLPGSAAIYCITTASFLLLESTLTLVVELFLIFLGIIRLELSFSFNPPSNIAAIIFCGEIFAKGSNIERHHIS